MKKEQKEKVDKILNTVGDAVIGIWPNWNR